MITSEARTAPDGFERIRIDPGASSQRFWIKESGYRFKHLMQDDSSFDPSNAGSPLVQSYVLDVHLPVGDGTATEAIAHLGGGQIRPFLTERTIYLGGSDLASFDRWLESLGRIVPPERFLAAETIDKAVAYLAGAFGGKPVPAKLLVLGLRIAGLLKLVGEREPMFAAANDEVSVTSRVRGTDVFIELTADGVEGAVFTPADGVTSLTVDDLKRLLAIGWLPARG